MSRRGSPVFRKPAAPGLQSEFDFCGATLRCGDGTKARFAVLVPNHSRMCRPEAIPDLSSSSAMTAAGGSSCFGGVAELVSIDNFKAAVRKAGKYGGELTDAFHMLEAYLDSSFASMQVRRGDLKGAAEAHVRIVTHTLIARMRQEQREGRQFASLGEMNAWLRKNLHRINLHRIHGLKSTRQELFEEERYSLKPMPSEEFSLEDLYSLAVPKTARITVGGHQYALPPELSGRRSGCARHRTASASARGAARSAPARGWTELPACRFAKAACLKDSPASRRSWRSRAACCSSGPPRSGRTS
jgi:hypothetical protein